MQEIYELLHFPTGPNKSKYQNLFNKRAKRSTLLERIWWQHGVFLILTLHLYLQQLCTYYWHSMLRVDTNPKSTYRTNFFKNLAASMYFWSVSLASIWILKICIYCTHAIVSHRLYFFNPLFEEHFFIFKNIFLENSALLYS